MNQRKGLFILIGAVSLVCLLTVSLIAGSLFSLISFKLNPNLVQAAESNQIENRDGLLVSDVAENSSADNIGIVRGDIIQQINGKEINTVLDFEKSIDALEQDDELILSVLHGDEVIEVKETINEETTMFEFGISTCDAEMIYRKMMTPGLFGEFEGTFNGVVVIEVIQDSPAFDAGLKEGDNIISVDGVEVDAENDLAEIISSYKPGEIITLEIKNQDGKIESIQVELGKNPDEENKPFLGIKYSLSGFEFEGGKKLPFEHGLFPFDQIPLDKLPGLKIPKNLEKGVFILEVEKGSPADEADLMTGDVIIAAAGESVSSPSELIELLKKYNPGDTLSLSVYKIKQEEEIEVEVKLGENPKIPESAFLGIKVIAFPGISLPDQTTTPSDEQGFSIPFFDSLPNELPFGFKFDLPFNLPFDIPLEDWINKLTQGQNA